MVSEKKSRIRFAITVGAFLYTPFLYINYGTDKLIQHEMNKTIRNMPLHTAVPEMRKCEFRKLVAEPVEKLDISQFNPGYFLAKDVVYGSALESFRQYQGNRFQQDAFGCSEAAPAEPETPSPPYTVAAV